MNAKPNNSNNNSDNSNNKKPTAAAATAAPTPSSVVDKQKQMEADATCVNFMSKFRDRDTRALKNLNSTQFIEVWNNYDKDGK